ncbi:hypothetical protein H2200_005933 [Cladophialophora chaetospira]|uniref:DUF2231 domain-containing protein n=1 Tax=Cladophialophora chaetospira TaxID=386627 RepID=A0AA38XA52_9EURO|nr:hypothetical protein H2200_005933 [Cladophialophora chaetospira]
MVYNTQLQSKFAHKVGEPVPEFNTDHPAHPALVHFPIAFNTLAWALDILYYVTITFKPEFLTSRFGGPAKLLDITRTSYFLLCVGLITTVPAIMSGNIQLVGMIKKNGGPWEKDATGKAKDTMVPRIKATITHAIINDLVFVAGLYSWYLRKDKEGAVNLGKVPNNTNIIISAVLLPFLMTAAKIGGTLTYNHGVGLNLGRKKFE